jgi:hypothetical protein
MGTLATRTRPRVVQVADVLRPQRVRDRLLDTPAPYNEVVPLAHPPVRDLPPQGATGLSVHREEVVAFPQTGAVGGQAGLDRSDDAARVHQPEADGLRAQREDAAEQQEIGSAEHQHEVHPPRWPLLLLSHAVRSPRSPAPSRRSAQDTPAVLRASEEPARRIESTESGGASASPASVFVGFTPRFVERMDPVVAEWRIT